MKSQRDQKNGTTGELSIFGMTLFLLVLLLINGSAYPFSFQRTYDNGVNNHFQAITSTTGAGLIYAGTSQINSFDGDLMVMKVNHLGHIEWEKTYVASEKFLGASTILQIKGRGFLVLSHILKNGLLGSWILQLSPNGQIVKQVAYEGGRRSIRKTRDNGYVTIGGNAFTTTVTKLSNSLDIEWEKTYDFGEGSSIQQTKEGGFIFSGAGSAASSFSKITVVKTDELGNIEWTSSVDNVTTGELSFIRQTKDSGYVLAGTTGDPAGSLGSDVLLVRLDPSGTVLFRKRFGTGGQDKALSVEPSKDGGFIVGGLQNDFNTFIVKLNSAGNPLWQHSYPDLRLPTPVGKAFKREISIVAGASIGLFGTDALVLKLDSQGRVGSQCNSVQDIQLDFLDEPTGSLLVHINVVDTVSLPLPITSIILGSSSSFNLQCKGN